MALLFWDVHIVLCMFHDTACRCHRCIADESGIQA
jgi:hypothetical protein